MVVEMMPGLNLNSGYKIPQLGFGTSNIEPADIGVVIKNALTVGYRHYDCAQIYENQPEIGQVLADHLSQGKIKREDLFITSKIWNTDHSYQKATDAIDVILRDLKLNYLDMCLIHWPMGYYEETWDAFPIDTNGKMLYSKVDYAETWMALEDAVKSGKVKSIGLSNFNIKQIERVLKTCKIKTSNLQVEVHPYFSQKPLIDWCKAHDIVSTCYTPLATPAVKDETMPCLFDDAVLNEIGRKHGKTAGQVCLRWHIQRGTVPIPKAATKCHMIENFDIWNFSLTEQEMTKIDNLNNKLRTIPMSHDERHPDYPFNHDK